MVFDAELIVQLPWNYLKLYATILTIELSFNLKGTFCRERIMV